MKSVVSLLYCLALLFSSAHAQQKKLALIIGNSHYEKGVPLPNPLNDARAMDNVLQQLGFTTLRYENLRLTELKKAIDHFGKQLHHYEIGLFYYAGHGLQHGGSNYLVPVDADLHMPQLIEFDCVPVDRVLAYMEYSGTAVNLLVLDACRNNPFERTWNRSMEGNGLAFMNAPSGSLIAYATAPGSVASDGTGENGLYTSMLLKHMITPNLTVEQVFKRVRADMEWMTNKTQVPWESTSLKGDFYFNPDSTLTAMIVDPVSGRHAAARDIQQSGRHAFRIQVEVPVQIGLGYGFHLTKSLSVDVQAGLLTQPNSLLLLNMMGSLGNDKLSLMIRNSFTSGHVYEGGFNYHFKNNYLGFFTQAIYMKGAAATHHVEENFNTDISVLPVKQGRTETEPQTIDLTSNLIQGGMLFGRFVPFKNPNWQVRLEFAVSKNFASSTRIHSADRDLSELEEDVDRQMDSWYAKYGYVPSLTIGLTYTFGTILR